MQLVLPLFSTLRRFRRSLTRTVPARVVSRRLLPARGTVPFSPRDEIRIRCVSGCLWITSGGSGGDVILHSGGSFTAKAGMLTVVEALEEAVVEMSA